MAIFGNLGRRISDAGQNVAQQTKDLAEITRLNSAISGYEKKQLEQFQMLGRAYYERSKDDPAAENREIMDAITEFYNQIQIANERIAVLRGFEKCPRCNANIPSGAQFCSACGLRIERGEASQNRPVFCINCGAKLEEDSRFCIVCGAKVNGSDEESEPIADDGVEVDVQEKEIADEGAQEISEEGIPSEDEI